MQDAIITIIERLGASRSRLVSITPTKLVRGDGYVYHVKTVSHGKIYFSENEYGNIRSHSGELLLFSDRERYMASMPAHNLPIRGGDVKLGRKTISLRVGFSKTHSSLKMHGQQLVALQQICGDTERNIKGNFKGIGDFAYQAVLFMAGAMGVLQKVVAVRSSGWTYYAACPACKDMALLDERPRDIHLAWLVNCGCGLSFIAYKPPDVALKS